MEWIETDEIQSGDIVETISRIPEHSPICKGMFLPIIKHYGIVCNVNGEQCLVHNVIGRTPTITPCKDVFIGRNIERVLRTGMCDQEILEKFYSCKDKKYSLFSWNCESLMAFIWGSPIGYPQGDAWSLGLMVVIVVVLFVVFFQKQQKA